MYISKTQLVNLLNRTGVRSKNNKVHKNDFRSIFGAKYKTPEWLLLDDYHSDVPTNYLDYVEIEEDKLGRAILPSTFSIAIFGDFSSADYHQSQLTGLVYQYSMKGNPRNVHYAYRLFLGSNNVSKNSGFSSLHESKYECEKEARSLIETQLFDLT